MRSRKNAPDNQRSNLDCYQQKARGIGKNGEFRPRDSRVDTTCVGDYSRVNERGLVILDCEML